MSTPLDQKRLAGATTPTFTTELANRTGHELPPTLSEAAPFGRSPHGLLTSNRSTPLERFALRDGPKMAEAGFRFAEFNPDQGRFRISRPYEFVLIPERGTLTILQASQTTDPC